MKSYSFPKSNRLKSRKVIGNIFTKSNAYGSKPLRILWETDAETEEFIGLKVLVAVPKRKLKRAVDRNRIKRLIRESFRQNKEGIDSFIKERRINCNIGILYNSNRIVSFDTINVTMIKLLAKFQDEYEKFAE